MPELAGAVGFSRVSDGCCDPRQQARACWTTLSLSFSALGTPQWLVSSLPHSSSSPGQAPLYGVLPKPLPSIPLLAQCYKVLCFGIWKDLPSGLFPGLKCPEARGPRNAQPSQALVGVGAQLPHPQCSWCSQAQPGEEPMGVAPGREQRVGEEMGKQGTLHPRKHPCSSAGVVPEHTHKQTDSDTHRQIQTHTETHTPNGCFPSLKASTSCPSTPLPPRA